jgi:23S rRNA (uridine2552-2'-O)-methyltransferase
LRIFIIAKTKSSSRWLQRHVKDPYVRKARADGYRSRAAFKLLEVDTRLVNTGRRLLIPGARVADLGAAPGGWSQVAVEKTAPGGRVVAVDLLEIAPIAGATILRGDFREASVQAQVAAALGGKADVVLSDLSPNITGIASADQARAAELVRAAIEFCREALKADGAFLVKVFQGDEFAGLLKELKGVFQEVRTIKPSASREESRETYLLARRLR